MADNNDFITIERFTIAGQDLSVAALQYDKTLDYDARISAVYLTTTADLTDEECRVSFQAAAAGSFYEQDTILTDGNRTMLFRDDDRQIYKAGDVIRVEVTNTTTPSVTVSGVLALEVMD